jgi:hypothetical protein
MAYTGTIVTEAEMLMMAGELVDATGNTEANHNLLVAHAEGYLSSMMRYDIKTNWGSLNAVYKTVFSEWAARYAAATLIAYNMGTVGATFTSLIEPEDMIQFHVYRMEQIEKQIKETDFRNLLGI